MYDPNVLFTEEQQFRQPWIVASIIVGDVISVVVLWFALTGIAGVGRDQAVAGTAAFAAVALLFGWLMLGSKMITEVRGGSVTVRSWPILMRRVIPIDQITGCEARTYSPLREYGGWGIRFGRSGKAYNMIGNRGVQLEIAPTERLLIGSQRADELASVIQSRMRTG